MHTSFNFDYLTSPVGGRAACAPSSTPAWPRSQPVGAPATWVLSSHDETRHVDPLRARRHRRGARGGAAVPASPADLALGPRRARAAALLTLALPGSRLPLPGRGARPARGRGPAGGGAPGPHLGALRAHRRGRDGCRVPLPWAGDRAAVRVHRATASRPGCRSRRTGRRRPWPRSRPTRPRRCRCTGPRCTCAGAAGARHDASADLVDAGRRRPRLRPGAGVPVRREPLRREPLDVRGHGRCCWPAAVRRRPAARHGRLARVDGAEAGRRGLERRRGYRRRQSPDAGRPPDRGARPVRAARPGGHRRRRPRPPAADPAPARASPPRSCSSTWSASCSWSRPIEPGEDIRAARRRALPDPAAQRRRRVLLRRGRDGALQPGRRRRRRRHRADRAAAVLHRLGGHARAGAGRRASAT